MGFLRETKELAEESGNEKDKGLHRTDLEKYLSVIFPELRTNDWIHDKKIDGCEKK